MSVINRRAIALEQFANRSRVIECLACALCFTALPAAIAQEVPAPVTTENAASPAEPEAPAVPAALVIEVRGSVDHAPPGVSPLADEGWTPVQVNDRLVAGTQLRTGLRSHVNLQFGDTTTVSVRSATHASIDQFFRSANLENVRVGLAYGTVRGGSSERVIKSDVVVDSPIATLAKRGTEGWELWVEPMTGRFRVALADHGLVEARQKLSADLVRSRLVGPGEYVTDTSIANLWIEQAVFNRNVTFHEPFSVTASDAAFAAHQTRGYGVVSPGGGSQLPATASRVSADFVLAQTADRLPPGLSRPDMVVLERRPVPRPEGHFGTPDTFRVLIPATTAFKTASNRPLIPSRR